jgi:hypothetical protein
MKDEVQQLKRELTDDMINYMKFDGAEHENEPNFDVGYTPQHVDQCGEILETFFQMIGRISELERNLAILDAVKATVLDLNQLNSECDCGLIETGEREQLCEIILLAARKAGLVSSQDDITEEWREW